MEEYEPIKVLGEGSFGKVYLMKHGKTRDLVCTKVIKLKNIPPKEQEACRNEVELLRRMCHPNIVGYTNSFLYKNCLCIIMEYCDAGDLGDRVNEAKGRLLPESKVMTWFVQTALGLHYMHTHRVLHRDIKTQNVFILSSGRVVLGDLGISKLLGGTRDFASTCIGTPYYMSPEIFKNHPYNDKSDVWALGCLLYELLTLKHAFDAQSLNGLAGKIIKGKFPSVSSDYSKNLRALVNDMLATNPKKRPDIEQILRKSFVQTRVKEFVADLNAGDLHRQDTAMNALSDQLIDLQMEDAVPMANLIVDDAEDGAGGPNAPSPSESDAATAAAKGSRSQLKAQKHQLELEEEKRIAAEMALNRLRRKAAERRRRASLSRSNSPVGEGGVGRIGSAGTPRVPLSPGSPDEGGGEGGGSSPSRGRRPSLLQEATEYVSNPTPRRRSASRTKPVSPDGSATSRRGERADDPDAAPPSPRGREGLSSTDAGDEGQGGRGSKSKRRSVEDKESSSLSPQRRHSPELPRLNLGASTPPAPALRSGRSSARSVEDPGCSKSYRKSDSVYEDEEDGDFFHVLKEQAKANARDDDAEINEREEELRAKLREAEQRCRDLQDNMRKVREAGVRRGSIASAMPPPAPAGSGPLEAAIDIGVKPVSGSDSDPAAAGLRARRGSLSRASSYADDDRASDFDEEPVPYCESNMEEIQDAPTPVGNIVDRVQFLKKKCTEGLGANKFEAAMDVLKRLSEGDCKAMVDGVEYDGNDDDDVETVLVKVIGRNKLHYWSLMDQLLLMS